MNISGDLTISEFKPQTQTGSTPNLTSATGALIGKTSFLDVMKTLQGSAQKGLDETLSGVLKPTSKSEAQSPNNETTNHSEPEEIENVVVKDEPSVEEEKTETEPTADLQEATNVTALPWFLVAEAKTNETVDPEIEAVIVDELQNQIETEIDAETVETGSRSENETLETFFRREEETHHPEENTKTKESSIGFEDTTQDSSSPVETSKEIKRPHFKKEETSRNEELAETSHSGTAVRLRNAEEEVKEFKLGEKKVSGKEAQTAASEEVKAEVSKEVALDSEKWKISRDKKTDSYLAIKNSAREEIKTAVLQQFGDSSSGKSSSGQEQSSRSGNGDSYSSLIKGNTLSGTSSIRETSSFRTETGEGKEGFASLSKKDMEKNFQSLIRTARVQILGEGKTVASIRMNPKDLGHMSLSISTDKDVIRGKLLVESDFVKQQLGAELANLKQELKASGLELESLVIEVREQEGSFAFNAESDKSGRDSRPFFEAFDAEQNPNYKSTFYEDEEFFSEENSPEANPFSEKTERKNEKLLDLKV
ncbi:flagellar hook-length control protein FliK [Leptospira gomenensis]|uniref:Flagellar hook-length control protein FliK n=1 Tax=Leptospira gomenensis TaxID=2484974 RepID=A0A5F1Y8W0_9LEPT|nr:flagellar hook-length control protein FliK [Leptospira gomenensis]TGK31812.1 flagellar hook-length control protein FliK [Leptospira gomenensis]TGK34776.1 flagellar hook-length control protein FliK [Leptospira gomenensis]TGK41561.1 flagellar hook-length control protein FliK [Leptospira gomenensis]TGK61481.1 flagellar hook-length control protein FliK [Leptospira gomenensis]